mmetsp:Transcript_69253/g.129295  ORF Transcript_69253/g.129295 Transcript_69253/m.129295 type:complete len:246 (+) Transcript_69253:50-787(+)
MPGLVVPLTHQSCVHDTGSCCQLPSDFLRTGSSQKLIHLVEVVAAFEVLFVGQWGRVPSHQDSVPALIHQFSLLLGLTTPEEEDDALPLRAQASYRVIREPLPAKCLVGQWPRLLNCQQRVEQEHALLGPRSEIAMRRWPAACFLEHVHKARWHRCALWYREGQPHGLSKCVVWILSDNDDAYSLERRLLEGAKHGVLRWEDLGTRARLSPRLTNVLDELLEPRSFDLCLHSIEPTTTKDSAPML